MAEPHPPKLILPLPSRHRPGRVPPFRDLALWGGSLALVILVAWGLGFRSGTLQHGDPPMVNAVEPPVAAPQPATVSPSSPAPAPAPAATGGITFATEPGQAQFELRHRTSPFRTVASGPVTLTGLPAGEYDLSVTCPGFVPATSSVSIAPAEVRSLPPVKLIPVSSPAQTAKADRGAPATSTGTVEFASDPPGAEVWELTPEPAGSRRRLGLAPLTLARFPPGAHEFEFQLPNSPPRRVALTVAPGETAQARVTWEAFPVAITSSPAGARVLVDGREPFADSPALTPVTLHLREGRHEIAASYPGLEPLKFSLVASQAAASLYFPFRHASLRLTSEPDGAAVYSQGRLLGQTPLELPVLAPGVHQYLLRREGRARTTLDLVLRNGENREAHAVLAVNPEPEPGFPFTNGHGLRMVWVPRLNGWAQATEMTQAAYQAVMNENPSDFQDPALPVENVTWAEALRFCERFTTAEQGRGFLPAGYRYALPTDEQWSILAEGSSPDQGIHSLDFIRQKPAPAGSLPPSPLGIHDAIGNVWEWCLDFYSAAVLDRALREGAPGERDKAGATHKILRGGSWNRSAPSQLQVSSRRAALPTLDKDYETGFRVVLIPRSE